MSLLTYTNAVQYMVNHNKWFVSLSTTGLHTHFLRGSERRPLSSFYSRFALIFSGLRENQCTGVIFCKKYTWRLKPLLIRQELSARQLDVAIDTFWTLSNSSKSVRGRSFRFHHPKNDHLLLVSRQIPPCHSLLKYRLLYFLCSF